MERDAIANVRLGGRAPFETLQSVLIRRLSLPFPLHRFNPQRVRSFD